MRRKGPWSKNETERFLEQTRVPLRLACNGASGHPVIASLWFLPRDDTLWCATQRTASVVSHLRRDPRCAFEVAPEAIPYRGLRGQGLAQLHEDRGEEILRLLIDRYLEDPNSRLAR
jgi:nitroimidazol reductase NimA-like FMN-containing flavoprotein (pyridoxamine 5'-phosphate oxidase superfamily)